MIPAGFCISVESWENDGDFYHTELVAGLNERQVKWYLRFINNLADFVSNDFLKEEDMVALFRENCTYFGCDDRGTSDTYDVDAASGAAHEVINQFRLWSVEQSGENLIRVIEKIEVYDFPYDVENISYRF